MKKIFIVCILPVICLLSLTACKDKENWKSEFIFETDINQDSKFKSGHENAETLDADEYRPTWIDIEPSDMPYQYANMFTGVFGASVIDTPKELLFIASYPGKLVLMEYDKSNGRIEPFCKLATCLHNTDECVAGNAVSLDYRSNILSLGRTRNMNDTWISKLDDGRFDFVAGPVKGFIRGDDGYYAITEDASLVRFKNGSDKPELLVEEFGYIKPVIIGKYLYAANVDNIIRIDLSRTEYEPEIIVSDVVSHYSTDGRHLYYLKKGNDGPALYRCDPDGSNQELVLSQLIFPAYLSYDEEYIYYSTTDPDDPENPDNGNIYRFPKDLSGEPELIYASGARFPFVYTLPTSPDTLLVHVNNSFYFLPKSGGELTELKLP